MVKETMDDDEESLRSLSTMDTLTFRRLRDSRKTSSAITRTNYSTPTTSNTTSKHKHNTKNRNGNTSSSNNKDNNAPTKKRSDKHKAKRSDVSEDTDAASNVQRHPLPPRRGSITNSVTSNSSAYSYTSAWTARSLRRLRPNRATRSSRRNRHSLCAYIQRRIMRSTKFQSYFLYSFCIYAVIKSGIVKLNFNTVDHSRVELLGMHDRPDNVWARPESETEKRDRRKREKMVRNDGDDAIRAYDDDLPSVVGGGGKGSGGGKYGDPAPPDVSSQQQQFDSEEYHQHKQHFGYIGGVYSGDSEEPSEGGGGEVGAVPEDTRQTVGEVLEALMAGRDNANNNANEEENIDELRQQQAMLQQQIGERGPLQGSQAQDAVMLGQLLQQQQEQQQLQQQQQQQQLENEQNDAATELQQATLQQIFVNEPSPENPLADPAMLGQLMQKQLEQQQQQQESQQKDEEEELVDEFGPSLEGVFRNVLESFFGKSDEEEELEKKESEEEDKAHNEEEEDEDEDDESSTPKKKTALDAAMLQKQQEYQRQQWRIKQEQRQFRIDPVGMYYSEDPMPPSSEQYFREVLDSFLGEGDAMINEENFGVDVNNEEEENENGEKNEEGGNNIVDAVEQERQEYLQQQQQEQHQQQQQPPQVNPFLGEGQQQQQVAGSSETLDNNNLENQSEEKQDQWWQQEVEQHQKQGLAKPLSSQQEEQPPKGKIYKNFWDSPAEEEPQEGQLQQAAEGVPLDAGAQVVEQQGNGDVYRNFWENGEIRQSEGQPEGVAPPDAEGGGEQEQILAQQQPVVEVPETPEQILEQMKSVAQSSGKTPEELFQLMMQQQAPQMVNLPQAPGSKKEKASSPTQQREVNTMAKSLDAVQQQSVPQQPVQQQSLQQQPPPPVDSSQDFMQQMKLVSNSDQSPEELFKIMMQLQAPQMVNLPKAVGGK
mmetsp:Transcript_42586/g.89373  ORF Transcript_42586/g.89373 Transcript_42586/m.89373 type:complete len:935 (+) Transcript_42586:202-3006(+)